MKRILFSSFLSLGLISTINPVLAKTSEAPQWSYSGEHGPQHWGELSPAYSTCKTGKNQSPVDIKNTLVDSDLPAIKFNYTMLTPEELVNNGHTLQVNMWSGGEIIVDGIKFKLKQFHFHTPSENTINGQNFPLEAHFVHLSEKNEIAVVAILFAPGPNDRTLTKILEKVPMKAGESVKLGSHSLKTLEFDDKLLNYYRFNGSLTTPPCTEGVRWIVMKQPYRVSKEQVEKIQAALKQSNNRPVQPLNARMIVE